MKTFSRMNELFYLPFVGVLLLLSQLSCKKDPALPKPAIPKWNMVYRFINLSKTDTVHGMSIDSYTYLPDINRTVIFHESFPKVGYYLPPPILYKDSATSILRPEQVYVGCTKQMGIRLGIRDGFDSLGARKYIYRNYYFKTKPINGPKDTLEYFRYPNDTLLATSYIEK